MTDALQLDFAADDTEAGFRLQRIEVYNWGTFDQRISTLELDGLNTLVTGENGSGKSTFIDALTTLLVPAHRIAYNRAAGADAKERDLRSYVLGHYRSEYNEMTGASKPVALRGRGGYSVVLGVFRNTGFDHVVTVAQVFWPAEQGQPNRFFVLAERQLSIAEHFRGFTAGTRQLKSQLRDCGAELFDAYPPYGARLRRLVGIQSEQAMDLFHQTVSMKAVGNLTDFVRAHMLDTKPVKPRIESLVTHFDDLTRAHDAVLRAKRQVELLTPIAEDGERHHTESALRELLDRCRQHLRHHFGVMRVEFLASELQRLGTEHEKSELAVARVRARRAAAKQRVDEIQLDIAGSGGDELRRLDGRLTELAIERDRRRVAHERFTDDARLVALPIPTDEAEMVDLRAAVTARRADLDASRTTQRDLVTELSVELKGLRAQHDDLTAEIESLRAQRGNIPRPQVELRALLAAGIGVEATILPFAGELIAVRDDESGWEGAAERLLRGLALSMLVPDEHYDAIQRWADARHLGQRLVYIRVPQHTRRRDDDLHRFSLVHKLTIRDDVAASLAGWLQAELIARANVACCETPEQFQREPRAITRAGQIKGGQRHEKDDRFAIHERGRYVLGWTNESKVAALAAQRRGLESQAQTVGAELSQATSATQASDAIADALARLALHEELRSIDWLAVAAEISTAEDARNALLAASDRLSALEDQLAAARRDHGDAEDHLEAAGRAVGEIAGRMVDVTNQHDELVAEIDNTIDEPPSDITERLTILVTELLPQRATRSKQLTDAEATARDRLQGEIDATVKRLERIGERLIGRMKDFAREFPVEAQELDASLGAVAGHVEVLDRLRADDLPRFEAEFRELLNENTLREIAGFQNALHQERTDIHERIEKINASLETIEYNRGRYIALVMEPTRDVEVRDFQAELRACTEGTVSMVVDPVIVEQKFHQVRTIIERFRGRAEYADADRRWMQKVTDVRNWFTFAASERWRADGSEHEHYSDSSGKSGGQKEKLAYTVLAASLAYQFGLELGETTSRSFRFVAIDEAFGRADTDATRFGLELFAKLHLQLLVVTPLQRISIIEPFVRRVGFVSVKDERSQITNLTIEDYRKRRDADRR